MGRPRKSPLGEQSNRSRQIRRLTHCHLDFKLEVGNVLEVLFQHFAVARQAERPCVVGDIGRYKVGQASPVLRIQAVNKILVNLLQSHHCKIKVGCSKCGKAGFAVAMI
jgi:hypothetical protein